jgi:hypothetical protein
MQRPFPASGGFTRDRSHTLEYYTRRIRKFPLRAYVIAFVPRFLSIQVLDPMFPFVVCRMSHLELRRLQHRPGRGIQLGRVPLPMRAFPWPLPRWKEQVAPVRHLQVQQAANWCVAYVNKNRNALAWHQLKRRSHFFTCLRNLYYFKSPAYEWWENWHTGMIFFESV